jgi:uncharacterized membrane protein YGL010W
MGETASRFNASFCRPDLRLAARAGIDRHGPKRSAPHHPMAAQKSADAWFAEYGASHQHPANEAIHWICVPAIFTSVLGFLWCAPVPETWSAAAPWFNWALVAIGLATIFYLRLSVALGAGMLFFMAMCYAGIVLYEFLDPWPLWKACAVVFVAAWIGQFAGHQIEGRKPSFLQDLFFLLIGPAWLLSRLYRKIGQKY